MSLQRFVGDFDFTRSLQRVTDLALLHQIKNVLRLAEGDIIIISDGKGNEGAAKLLKVGKDFADLSLQGLAENVAEPDRTVILYCAILKKENFEWVVQKATEVGAKVIVPIVTKRTVKLGLNDERLHKIVKEAAEQSGRGVVPTVHQTLTFAEAYEHAMENELNLFLEPRGSELSAVWPKKSPARVGVWIGPEGGWDVDEFEAARAARFALVFLSPLVFRAETAAVVGCYLAVRYGE